MSEWPKNEPILLRMMHPEITAIDHDVDWMFDMVYEALHKPTDEDHFNMFPEVLQRLIKKTQKVLAIINQIKKFQEILDDLESAQHNLGYLYREYCDIQKDSMRADESDAFKKLCEEIEDLSSCLTKLNDEWPKLDPTRKEEEPFKEVKQDGMH